MTVILGISAFYHDSAAALVIDGEIIAAAQEERFTRCKNDASFPTHAISYVLREAGLTGENVDYVAFYEKSFLKFERILETYYAFAPKGIVSFVKSIPLWMKEKLFVKQHIISELKAMDIKSLVLFPEHHLSHAASAFYPSPYEDACILTVDGVGEWATTTIGKGKGNKITCLREIHFPHSLGLFYSAFTYYCGFKVNGGEYKLMGLAPYGQYSQQAMDYIRLIKEHLIDIRLDGSFLLNMNYYNYATGLTMTNDKLWKKIFNVPPRKPESDISQPYIDLAFAAQFVIEEVMLKLAHTAKELTNSDTLVMAGGVALNCVSNEKLYNSRLFKHIWVQPASGDAGGAVGAALAIWHTFLNNKRIVNKKDGMSNTYLGPSFSQRCVDILIRNKDAHAELLSETDLLQKVSVLLRDGAIVGWFQGRMEFGPRSLGNRSILADPRAEGMQKRLNLKIKFRESFRPFAPCILEEDVSNYFERTGPSPYMLFTTGLLPELRKQLPENYKQLTYSNKLYAARSALQAVTHVDFSARIQTVSRENNSLLYDLLRAFKTETGCGILVNTSFNVRGEPIVCNPEDAYSCFCNTGMDYLVIGNYLFSKNK
nr:carbamoyltransferase [uncultured Macellibacteroides sp.]